MYMLIYFQEPDEEIYYNNRTKKIVKSKKISNMEMSKKSQFGAIGIGSIILERVTHTFSYSYLEAMALVFLTSIMLSLSFFYLIRIPRNNRFDREAVQCSEKEVLSIWQSKRKTIDKMYKDLLELASMLLSCSLFVGGVYYFFQENILFLLGLLILLIATISCGYGSLIYFIVFKREYRRLIKMSEGRREK